MRLQIESKLLQAGIATVIKSLSARPSMPILEGIYLQADERGVLLRCSDLTLQIETLIPAEVHESGMAVLPGRLFSEMVRRFSSDMIEIALEDKSIQMRAGRSHMSLQYADAREFPDMAGSRGLVELKMPQNQLKDMIRQTVFASAQEETKPILMGVLCEVEDTSLHLVALDGFRLALRRANLSTVYEHMEAVVPAKSMMEIARTLLDTEDEIPLSFSKTHLSIEMGDTKIISRLLDGDYIKYKGILPADHQTRMRINREELLGSIERAILLAREGNNNLVRFNLEENTLKLFANSALGRMEEEIEVQLNGQPMQIAFNARYFSDVLKALGDEEIYMDLNNNVSPCVVKPIQGDAFYYLILPVRIFA